MAAKKTTAMEKAERAVVLRERDVLRLVNRWAEAFYRYQGISAAKWFYDLRIANSGLQQAKWKATQARRAARKAAR